MTLKQIKLRGKSTRHASSILKRKLQTYMLCIIHYCMEQRQGVSQGWLIQTNPPDKLPNPVARSAAAASGADADALGGLVVSVSNLDER